MAPETKIPKVHQNAVLPCCVVSHFKVKEDSQDMLFVNKGFKMNEVIQCTVVLPKTTLLL